MNIRIEVVAVALAGAQKVTVQIEAVEKPIVIITVRLTAGLSIPILIVVIEGGVPIITIKRQVYRDISKRRLASEHHDILVSGPILVEVEVPRQGVNGVFVDRTIAVVVDVIAALVRARRHGSVGVITVHGGIPQEEPWLAAEDSGRQPSGHRIPAAVLIDIEVAQLDPITVLVSRISWHLLCAWKDGALAIVAIGEFVTGRETIAVHILEVPTEVPVVAVGNRVTGRRPIRVGIRRIQGLGVVITVEVVLDEPIGLRAGQTLSLVVSVAIAIAIAIPGGRLPHRGILVIAVYEPIDPVSVEVYAIGVLTAVHP